MKPWAKAAALLSLTAALCAGPAAAQNAPPPAVAGPTPGALDPALQKMFMALATAMLANVTAGIASGTPGAFDPGPLLESTLRNALNSRELQAALDRLVESGFAQGEGAEALSPEMRLLLNTALKGAVTLARNEIAREFAPPARVPAPALPDTISAP